MIRATITVEEARALCEAGYLSVAEYVAFRNTPSGRKPPKLIQPDKSRLKEAERNSSGC